MKPHAEPSRGADPQAPEQPSTAPINGATQATADALEPKLTGQQAWAARIAEHWRPTATGALATGRDLIAAKEQLPTDEFGSLVKSGLPFGLRTAQRLIVIARDPRLTLPDMAATLPASWRTLYELTQLSHERFLQGVQDGVIRPEMTRAEVARLREPEGDAAPAATAPEPGIAGQAVAEGAPIDFGTPPAPSIESGQVQSVASDPGARLVDLASQALGRERETVAADEAPAPARTIHVRLARPEDLVAIYELLARSLEEIPHYPEPDEAAALAWILRVVHVGAALVAAVDGEIVGTLGLEPRNFPWARESGFLGWCWYYVEPDFRDGASPTGLMTMAQRFAASVGLPLLLGVTAGGDPAELKERFTQENGLQYVGGCFHWCPPPAEASDRAMISETRS